MELIRETLKKHEINNEELEKELDEKFYKLTHPKCYCRSCCEKRGDLYLEDLYADDEE